MSAFRESKSDDRRFYIFSPTKTLHLKTDSKDDRVAWIEALILARSVYSLRSLSGRVTFVQCDVSISTTRLRDRMHQEGLNENLIQDCEQIVLSEFSSYRKQLKRRYEDYLSLFGSCRHNFEVRAAAYVLCMCSRLCTKVTSSRNRLNGWKQEIWFLVNLWVLKFLLIVESWANTTHLNEGGWPFII